MELEGKGISMMSEQVYSYSDNEYTDDICGIVQGVINDYDPDEDLVFPFELELDEGDSIPHTFAGLTCIETLIENASERSYEECGEYSDNFLENVTDEQKADLRTVMDEWADRHGLQPTFHPVKRTGKITVIVLDEDGDWKIKEEA
jgi:hypothetical protein